MTEFCPTCGAKVMEYKHSLSKGLIRAFLKFAKQASLTANGTVNLNDCDMNLTERTNFYKLRYWGLLNKADLTNDRGGEWRMYEKGWKFVKGEISVSKHAWSYRGEFTRFDDEQVFIMDVTDGWKYRPQYAREAQPYNQRPLL